MRILWSRQWIEEAEAAIKKVSPAAPAVVEATRTFEGPVSPSVLIARLADGSEWVIDRQVVRQHTVDEIAESEPLRESWML
jgi:hypothetical protein